METQVATMDTLPDGETLSTDVLVIGGGNAALFSAISARRGGARVLLLEAAPFWQRGGNSRHTRDIRYVHSGPTRYVTGPYLEEEFWADIVGISGEGEANEDLARLVIRESEDLPDWAMANGVRFQPPLKGTLHLARTNVFMLGGGRAMMNAYYHTAQKLGVEVRYEAKVESLTIEDGAFRSATFIQGARRHPVSAKAVVVASGGFEANLDWLREYWGDGAENFVVRGTPHNTGAVLKALLEHGVETVGDPTEFHAVALDARAPKFDGGIITRLDSVPFGIVVNRNVERFYDEGEDFWPKRYATWGRKIAKQPGQIAYSIIDHTKLSAFMPSVFPPIRAESIADLAAKLDLDPASLEAAVDQFNRAVQPGGTFNPSALDDCTTEGLTPRKSHWATCIESPPFYAYPLRPGITFTYMGVKVDDHAHVLLRGGTPASNLFAAGEIMSGNILTRGYLAGFGLTIGAVFGRIAGKQAALVANGALGRR